MNLDPLGSHGRCVPRRGRHRRRVPIWSTIGLALALHATPVFARNEVRLFLAGVGGQSLTPQLDLASLAVAPRRPFTFSLFAAELAAYLAKEAFQDSADEFGSSPISSRLSGSMPALGSDFGTHCLTIATTIGSSMPSFGFPTYAFEDDSVSLAAATLQGAATALALRQIWSAFRKDIVGERHGFSLDPKVSARQVRVNLVFHW